MPGARSAPTSGPPCGQRTWILRDSTMPAKYRLLTIMTVDALESHPAGVADIASREEATRWRDRFATWAPFRSRWKFRSPGTSADGWAQVKCLVDTEAAFSQFPDPLFASLRLTPDRRVPVILADGTRKEQSAAWLEIRYGTRTAFMLVLFAGTNGLTLLGPARFPLA